jgi:hypothetical protein
MTRLKNDQYFTPQALVWPLLREIQFNADALYFEPCAGDGAIAKAFTTDSNEVNEDLFVTADIDTDLKGLEYRGFDATDSKEWANGFTMFNPDWVITNPPYKQPDCDAIIRNAWEFAEEGIAMLLRLSYLEPCQNRAKFLKEANLSNLIIFNPRPQFIPGKKATDSSTVAWFVWRKNWLSLGTCITYCTDWND